MKDLAADQEMGRLQPWGGFDVVLGGDWNQIEPVEDSLPSIIFKMLITPEEISDSKWDLHKDAARSFFSFRRIKLLSQNRARDDPDHTARINKISNYENLHPIDHDMIQYLASIPLTAADLASNPCWITRAVHLTASNTERHIFNLSWAKLYAEHYGIVVVRWLLRTTETSSIVCSGDGLTQQQLMDDYPEVCGYFVRGAPCTVNYNVKPEKGIANGSQATFNSLMWDVNDPSYNETAQAISMAAPGSVVTVPIPPKYYVIEYELRFGISLSAEETISETDCPPINPGYKCVAIPTNSPDQTLEKLSNVVVGAQLIPVYSYYEASVELLFACTYDKSQGKTLHEVILHVDKNPFKSPDIPRLYVGLTRVTNSNLCLRIWPSENLNLERFLKKAHKPALICLDKAYDAQGNFQESLYRQAYDTYLETVERAQTRGHGSVQGSGRGRGRTSGRGIAVGGRGDDRRQGRSHGRGGQGRGIASAALSTGLAGASAAPGDSAAPGAGAGTVGGRNDGRHHGRGGEGRGIASAAASGTGTVGGRGRGRGRGGGRGGEGRGIASAAASDAGTVGGRGDARRQIGRGIAYGGNEGDSSSAASVAVSGASVAVGASAVGGRGDSCHPSRGRGRGDSGSSSSSSQRARSGSSRRVPPLPPIQPSAESIRLLRVQHAEDLRLWASTQATYSWAYVPVLKLVCDAPYPELPLEMVLLDRYWPTMDPFVVDPDYMTFTTAITTMRNALQALRFVDINGVETTVYHSVREIYRWDEVQNLHHNRGYIPAHFQELLLGSSDYFRNMSALELYGMDQYVQAMLAAEQNDNPVIARIRIAGQHITTAVERVRNVLNVQLPPIQPNLPIPSPRQPAQIRPAESTPRVDDADQRRPNSLQAVSSDSLEQPSSAQQPTRRQQQIRRVPVHRR